MSGIHFTHLHTHTHYSLLDGLSKIGGLISKVTELGMDSIAITDHGNLYGAIEFYKKAKAAGVKPIIGCELYISNNSMYEKRPNVDDERFHLIVLAKNLTGYKNLIKLVTKAHLEGFYYKPRVDKKLLRQHSDGLIALSACLGGEISRALIVDKQEKAEKIAKEYQDIFGHGNFFIELQQHPNITEQNLVNQRLLNLSRKTGMPIVATQDSHYINSGDVTAHDILLAVQTQNRTDDKDRLTMKSDDFSLLSPEAMYEKFSKISGITNEELKSLFENTQKIVEACDLEIELGKVQLPHFPIPTGFLDNFHYLEYLCKQGLEKRFESEFKASREIKTRLEYELDVIKQTGFTSYFLIVNDFVTWAKNQGIIVGPGRGSAAGSLVSYLLGITNVDPIKYGLFFERFLNPSRVSAPDIDLDFDDNGRYRVLNYVANKYGHDHVAQIITFGTMMSRGAIRDAGRAMGLSYDFCDQIAKMIPFNTPLKVATESVSDLKQLYRTSTQAKELIDAASKLEGVARHASTHACGVVIAPQPLVEYLPLQRPTQGDETGAITQFEMHAVEDLGLLKMDFLGLSNLTIIEEALKLIKENHSVNIDFEKLPFNDLQTFKLLQDAKTTGVFQLESSGMKRYLKQLKPTEIEDIIAMVSLYRPGPMDLIPEYIARKHGKKKIEYLHEKLEPILKNTYGIMIYQEQLISAVQSLGGFTLAEADVMRRAVGKKIKKLLDEQEKKFIEGANKIGTPKTVANKFWELVEPFNRYGFNRSHAACYAILAYQTAYLKAHFPLEFMAALMNSHAGDIERIAFLIDECREMGIEVLPPSINESAQKFSVLATLSKNGDKIRFGLSAVKNVGENLIEAIITERNKNGKFSSIESFVTRIMNKDLNKKSIESLAKCGAFDELGERNQLLANADQLLSYARETQKHSSRGQVSLFGFDEKISLPPLRLIASDPASKNERLAWEKELLGLFISDHPVKDYQLKLQLDFGTTDIKLATQKSGANVKIGGLVTKVQRITTKTGQLMLFGWLEDLTSKVELVIFPKVIEKNPTVWQENKIIVVRGRVNERDGVPKIICDEATLVASLV